MHFCIYCTYIVLVNVKLKKKLKHKKKIENEIRSKINFKLKKKIEKKKKIYIYTHWILTLHNGHPHRKWNQESEFKSWTS